ncbi:DUF1492 domain-containing protein [Paenibacillus endoradicis]|uniref:DUF1492 domain-containing protein n=1 Tax=Paenibacillus endoradicis TaxID=2972487 RepID=UPI0021593A50|nr:DUF1492 domain-containing protein [Paenibacillus endoradicis]MCR8656954.1 DUF1492 domain-containing protein [Paenibacillus endoradicis]
MTEQELIEQLSNYKRLQARMQVLSSYSVGGGITVSRLNQDDQLQELHQKLRGLPSYAYLNKREQKLEKIAHTYLGYYPAGVKSQERVIPIQGIDDEDTKLLKELKHKIEKVVAARGYDIRDDLDAVLDRVAEYQDLQETILKIDMVLNAVEQVKRRYAELLRLRYIDEMAVAKVCERLGVSESTYKRWHRLAIVEYTTMTVK